MITCCLRYVIDPFKVAEFEDYARRWLPLMGPLLLLGLWQLMISAHWVKAVLLPPPMDTLAHLGSVFASGHILPDLWATVFRTLASFAIAVAHHITVMTSPLTRASRTGLVRMWSGSAAPMAEPISRTCAQTGSDSRARRRKLRSGSVAGRSASSANRPSVS